MKKLSPQTMEKTKGGFVWAAFWLGVGLVILAQAIIDYVNEH